MLVRDARIQIQRTVAGDGTGIVRMIDVRKALAFQAQAGTNAARPAVTQGMTVCGAEGSADLRYVREPVTVEPADRRNILGQDGTYIGEGGIQCQSGERSDAAIRLQATAAGGAPVQDVVEARPI